MQITSRPLLDWRQTPRPRFRTWSGSAVLIGLGAPLLGHLLLRLSARIFAENSYVETLQASLLAAAAVLFLVAFARSTDAKAIFCAMMAVLSAVALQREIPSCGSAFYEGGACLTRTAKGSWTVLVVASGLGLVLARRVRWRSFLDLRHLAWVWPIAVAGLLLAMAELAEHQLHQEMEETLEFGAYAYLAAFALWACRSGAPRTRDPLPRPAA